MRSISYLMKMTLIEFKKNDPLRMAGATAFFTTFALPPILFIIVSVFGFFLDRRTFAKNLMMQLAEVIGKDSVLLIRQTLRNVIGFDYTWYTAVLGFIFLLFISTTLFVVIKNSLNQIWYIRVKASVGIKFQLKQRARSLGIIILAGILFTSVLLIETVRTFLGKYVEEYNFEFLHYLKSTLNEVIFAIIVMLWFTVLFRYIPDGRPRWKNAFFGGLFTAILFTAGKLTIRFFLAKSNIQLIYNSSGALVLILLFVFYSSIIFYYGGCFVKVVSDHLNEPIHPIQGSYKFEIREIVAEVEEG
jgi:membrane protein